MFYSIYTCQLKAWGRDNTPEYAALSGVTFLMYLNLLIIPIVLAFFGINLLNDRSVKKEFLIAAIVIAVISYLRFVHKGKYIEIAQAYKHELGPTRFKKTILIWLYTGLSFIVPGGLAFLLSQMKQ